MQHDVVAAKEVPDQDRYVTQKEAAQILKLDQLGLKDPTETVRYLRRTRQIAFTKVAGRVLVDRQSLLQYMERNRQEVMP